MNDPSCKPTKRLNSSLVLLCVAFLVSGCGGKAAMREQERARYETLESELISAQEAQERRRRSEFRIAQRLQKMDAERAAASRARRERLDEELKGQPRHPGLLTPGTPLKLPSVSTPLVTQVVVGQPSSTADNRLWRLQSLPSPVDGSPLCAVASTPVVVRNGTLDTTVTIIVSSAAVFLRTDARFDTTAPETGYRIDAGIPIAFDRFFNELTAVVDESHARLLSAMQAGSTLTVAFAYSPQLSSAEIHMMELALDSFKQPWSGIAECKGS